MLSHPEPPRSLLDDHQIIHYKHHHFPCSLFPPHLQRAESQTVRTQKTSHEVQAAKILAGFGIPRSEGEQGREENRLVFFPCQKGSVPCWPIPAVSPQPARIPSHGASVGHGLPLASTARAPPPQLPLNEPPEPFQLSRQEESGSVLRVMTHN